MGAIITRRVMATMIETKQLGRQDEDGNWLVRNIDLRVSASDRLAIVGSSGSGKTVLLRAIARLDPISEGQILFRGQQFSGTSIPSYRTEVVYLQQQASLFEGTVEANLRKPFELAIHCDRKFNRDRVLAWLEVLGRGPEFLDKDQQNLSGGESQITALLRAMQLEPKVFLLDEPTSALDEASTTAVETLLNQWFDDTPDAAFLWITHSDKQAERMCDRSLQMTDGQLKGSE